MKRCEEVRVTVDDTEPDGRYVGCGYEAALV